MGMAMTPDDLDRIGRTLYGKYWAVDVRTALGIAERTFDRYRAGTRKIPADMESKLISLAIDRERELAALVDTLTTEDGERPSL